MKEWIEIDGNRREFKNVILDTHARQTLLTKFAHKDADAKQISKIKAGKTC